MSVFQIKDLTLCNVPVIKGYPQSQTHAGVVVFKDKILLTTSPFPNPHRGKYIKYLYAVLRRITKGVLGNFYIGEEYENPLIYVGKGSNNPPVDFSLCLKHPLMPLPDKEFGYASFNSDPDICINGDEISVLNRRIFRISETGCDGKYKFLVRVYRISLTVEADKAVINGINQLVETTNPFVSPCHIPYEGGYLYAFLDTNSYNDGSTFGGLYVKKTNCIDEIGTVDSFSKVYVRSEIFIPWHMSLFEYRGKLYSIVACVRKNEDHRAYQMLGVFNEDLTELTIFQKPLISLNSYRGAAIVLPDGEFVLYSTTVMEKIKHSRSVDGRDVVMARMPFVELLKRIDK